MIPLQLANHQTFLYATSSAWIATSHIAAPRACPSVETQLKEILQKAFLGDFPGSLVFKTQSFHGRGHGFDP